MAQEVPWKYRCSYSWAILRGIIPLALVRRPFRLSSSISVFFLQGRRSFDFRPQRSLENLRRKCFIYKTSQPACFRRETRWERNISGRRYFLTLLIVSSIRTSSSCSGNMHHRMKRVMQVTWFPNSVPCFSCINIYRSSRPSMREM